MNSLDKLREQKKAYIKEQADKIILGMERRKVTTDTLATCDYSNWDRELHRNMNDISTNEEIEMLEEIMETKKDTALTFVIKPTKKQFREFVKKNGFSNGEMYIKI